MQIIVVTYPDFFPNEADAIVSLFEAGLSILHLRKPDAAKEEYEHLLQRIPSEYHNRIQLHEYIELADQYNVRGVHLNRRNPEYNGTKRVKISKSCHAIEELNDIESFDYVFLSPVFDSISKAGYNSRFSLDTLSLASRQGLINEKVVALGGINHSNVHSLEQFPFGGFALLGAIWNGNTPLANYKNFIIQINDNKSTE